MQCSDSAEESLYVRALPHLLSELIREDLPTLGYPTMPTVIAVFSPRERE